MTSVSYETGTPSFERRIGGRVRTDWVEVTWVEPRDDDGSSNGNGDGSSRREFRGFVEEVSVTGASILGPPDLPVSGRCRFTVRYEGCDSTVIVHRSLPTEDVNFRRFGVEFVELDPALRARVYEMVADQAH